MSEHKITVLITDDQRLMREGLRLMLEGASDIEVVGEAENGLVAIELAEKLKPDVILMDIRMPLLDGLEATARILKGGSQRSRILLLTTFDTPELVVEGLRAGAAGYLLKDCSLEELCNAVRTVARGQVLLQTSSAAQLLAGIQLGELPASREESKVTAAKKIGLTGRELEIIELIAEGQSNPQIAARLLVSDATVKTHINHIFAKLEVSNRSQMIVKVRQLGLA